jgi:hypothetical protein
VFFCLIIRTAYQGKNEKTRLTLYKIWFVYISGVFFEMMTSDMRKKLPETIRELHPRKYTILYIEEDRASYEVLKTLEDETKLLVFFIFTFFM